ncbi:hypothetical protein, partial [Escherichia coli]|uniref:hypothetical protein n=1 Tax=Escherichia coli TaxID=562 RepID=UPI003F44A9DB
IREYLFSRRQNISINKKYYTKKKTEKKQNKNQIKEPAAGTGKNNEKGQSESKDNKRQRKDKPAFYKTD